MDHWLLGLELTVYAVYLIGMTIVILLDNKPPQSTLAWLLTLYFLPFIGLFIYLFAGVNWRRRRIVKQRPEEMFSQHLSPVIERQRSFLRNMRVDGDNDLRKTIQLLLNSNQSVLTLRNSCTVHHHGSDHFAALKADLRQAKRYIHMEYFIWRSDRLGQEILDILVERAQAGVEVRLIFDRVGCVGTLSRAYRRALKAAGIEYRYFLSPLSLLTSNLANYLNHRKIVVVDGLISYVGGLNLGQEYIDGGKRFDFWRDTHLRFVGEITQQLQTVFATDWYNSSREWLDDQLYFPDVPTPEQEASFLPVQLACSGPDSDWYAIKQLFFNLIINANQTVFIQSPYFIPDQSVVSAMEIAALSGVEVHLMMAGIPDKRLPFWVAHTYFESLLRAGVHIYQYTRGFMHAKTLVVDGLISSVGTCNMDVRAFELDYEVNAVIYDAALAQNLRDQFFEDLRTCREITLNEELTRPLPERLRNSLLRVLSPLL